MIQGPSETTEHRDESSSGDGHRPDGRFAAGNRCATGANAYTVMGTRIKMALAAALTQERMTAVLDKLFDAARAGEPWAIREVLDRCIGRPAQTLVTEDAEGNREALSLPTLIVEWRPARVSTGIPGADRVLAPLAQPENHLSGIAPKQALNAPPIPGIGLVLTTVAAS